MLMATPAFVRHLLRAERFLAFVEDRWDRFEGYQDLLWSLELLLRDVLGGSDGSFGLEGQSLTKLLHAVQKDSGLPKPLQLGLDEVVTHRNIFVHALGPGELDGRTYFDDLECVRTVALWYLRDCQKGPRLGVAEAERLLAGGENPASPASASFQVFLSYAAENEAEARHLYTMLEGRGHHPWMDKHDLLPGQQWEIAIRRAIEGADFFVALMSRNSVTKRGFVQKEIRFALDVLGEVPPGRIYFIPARLDECEVPDAIRQLHWIDLRSEDAYAKLWRAIEKPMCHS
jgi:hypothetical protein